MRFRLAKDMHAGTWNEMSMPLFGVLLMIALANITISCSSDAYKTQAVGQRQYRIFDEEREIMLHQLRMHKRRLDQLEGDLLYASAEEKKLFIKLCEKKEPYPLIKKLHDQAEKRRREASNECESLRTTMRIARELLLAVYGPQAVNDFIKS